MSLVGIDDLHTSGNPNPFAYHVDKLIYKEHGRQARALAWRSDQVSGDCAVVFGQGVHGDDATGMLESLRPSHVPAAAPHLPLGSEWSLGQVREVACQGPVDTAEASGYNLTGNGSQGLSHKLAELLEPLHVQKQNLQRALADDSCQGLTTLSGKCVIGRMVIRAHSSDRICTLCSACITKVVQGVAGLLTLHEPVIGRVHKEHDIESIHAQTDGADMPWHDIVDKMLRVESSVHHRAQHGCNAVSPDAHVAAMSWRVMVHYWSRTATIRVLGNHPRATRTV